MFVKSIDLDHMIKKFDENLKHQTTTKIINID
jgi:hypothetical protein